MSNCSPRLFSAASGFGFVCAAPQLMQAHKPGFETSLESELSPIHQTTARWDSCEPSISKFAWRCAMASFSLRKPSKAYLEIRVVLRNSSEDLVPRSLVQGSQSPRVFVRTVFVFEDACDSRMQLSWNQNVNALSLSLTVCSTVYVLGLGFRCSGRAAEPVKSQPSYLGRRWCRGDTLR